MHVLFNLAFVFWKSKGWAFSSRNEFELSEDKGQEFELRRF